MPASSDRRHPSRTRAAAPAPWSSDLDYLRAELEWIEARCERLALERLAVRVASPDYHPSFGDPVSKIDRASLPRRVAEAHELEKTMRVVVDERLAAHRAKGAELALDRLCRTHGLDDFERTVVLLAAAPCISRRLEREFGRIETEDMPVLTVDATFAFAELDFAERVARRGSFARRSRLVANDLIAAPATGRFASPKELLSAEVEIRPRTFAFLLGERGLGDELADLACVEEPCASIEQVVLPEKDKRRIVSLLDGHAAYLAARARWGLDQAIPYGRAALMLFHGAPGTGKTMAAHAVAQRLGKRVLLVDVPTFVESQDAGRFLPGLFREARLQDAVLFFDECETLLESRRRGNNVLMTTLLTELERFDGVAVLATNLPELLDEALDRRILLRVRFASPSREAREAIWRGLLPPSVPLAPDVDLAALAERYEMAGGYIKNAVLLAVSRAAHEAGEAGVITHAMLDEAASEQCAREGADPEGTIAQVPRAQRSDLIVDRAAGDQLDELIAAARSRRTVLERWGLGAHLSYGKGIAALLHGEPGTGKTLCAEVIAGELHRPLLTASIAGLLSKWIGETERNLETLFDRARRLGAVLFLDEVDALLGDREGAGASRHDVSAVNVLLTAIERHEGVVLLATNLPARLDRALDRRLTYRIELRAPGSRERAAIWRRLLASDAPLDGVIDVDALAEAYPLSGARIRNAVFQAAFRCASAGRAIGQAELERAAREESAPSERRRSIGFAPA